MIYLLFPLRTEEYEATTYVLAGGANPSPITQFLIAFHRFLPYGNAVLLVKNDTSAFFRTISQIFIVQFCFIVFILTLFMQIR